MQAMGPKRMVVKKQALDHHGRRHPGGRRHRDLNPDHALPSRRGRRDPHGIHRHDRTYTPAERNRPEDAPIGLIPVDSLFSPVRRVSYRVRTPARARLDFSQADHA